jgi:hypothetical protein
MQLIMNDERLQTVEQVKQFLAGSGALDFGKVSVEERYQWIQTVLVRFKYYQLKRAEKGVYHINAVDEVTQWKIVASVEKIAESYLVPILESMLVGFPFVIRGFHSDNGSEFINKTVVKLLNKLLIRFTKCRPRHTNVSIPGCDDPI